MRKQYVPFKRLATEDALEQLADEMKFPSLEALYVAVGEGQVSPQSIVARLARSVQGSTEEDVTEVPLARPVHLGQPSSTDVTSGVVVQGRSDVWVRLARCCTPGARGRDPRVRHPRAGRLGPPHRLPEREVADLPSPNG